jgi:prolyl oligopeptidase
MVAAGYASREKLALMGGSNGGLLMGAMITQHPELARAVVSLVGLYDMLRVERTPNGAYNVPEFGTVVNPAEFRALYAYSPYHRVVPGTAYPSILMVTGENDPRVDPWHSRKMIARLQAATSSHRPILLRTNAAAGHGRGTPLSDQIDEYTDVLTFLMRELGVE